MYRPNFYESTCFRCNEIVYQVDRVGPLKDFTFFHSGCFKCANCGTKLTLKWLLQVRQLWDQAYFEGNITFINMYRLNFYEITCFRCNEIVYQVDRVGPLKDFTFFHSGCFKCANCGTKLTLKTYYNNQHWTEDKEVYCSSHVPKIGPGHLDNSSVGIRSALNVPRSTNYVNEQIRGLARNSHDAERESYHPFDGHCTRSPS
ncbi:Kyphoscoliosis peptidase [Operophtera brumata]|uniref:Kyphoscoliosis peptidase n=1 Tax=Operophtera brumata TaxID=104452 RepID=A0A0L7L705_OPEBR|nr:Kyphoscoliosis peptidase [Operophtera brumata]